MNFEIIIFNEVGKTVITELNTLIDGLYGVVKDNDLTN